MQAHLRLACRANVPVRLVAAAFLLAFWATPAAASEASFGDPDDVALRLDLKTVSHSKDGASVTYTAETYESFPDAAAAFKWRIDRNGDGVFEVNAFAEWDVNALIGGVEAGGGDIQLAPATVSRPAPNAIRVTFPVSAFAGSTSYGYVVIAETDLNDDGETDPNEFDRAPDAGVIQHSLAEAPAPGSASEAPLPQQQPGQAAGESKAAGARRTGSLPRTGAKVALLAIAGIGLTAFGVRLTSSAKGDREEA
jgi:hypothetical protein